MSGTSGDHEAVWQAWLKSFSRWEHSTAAWLEQALKSPVVTEPAARALSAWMRVSAARDAARDDALRRAGLATAHDQERTLHALHQLEARLIDLRDDLDDLRTDLAAARQAASEPDPAPRQED